MTDHPRLQNLCSTSQLFHKTTSSFTSNLPTFLFLSLLLSFQTIVEDGTRHVTSFIDRDPSLKALLSYLDLASTQAHRHCDASPATSLRHWHGHHRGPFLYLTHVGTLDKDFFSGDHHDDNSPFGSTRRAPLNGTLVFLGIFGPKVGLLDRVVDNGINIPKIVRTGITFKADNLSLYLSEDEDDKNDDREESETIGLEEKAQDLDIVVDFQFLIRGLELGRLDIATLCV